MAGLRLFSRERAPKVRWFVLQSVKVQIDCLGQCRYSRISLIRSSDALAETSFLKGLGHPLGALNTIPSNGK
jgi:hypothetical protein